MEREKFNLKNRPLHSIEFYNKYPKLSKNETDEWFGGFEKEQRFLLSKNKHGVLRIAILLDNYDKLGLDPVQAIEWFIKKEILGE